MARRAHSHSLPVRPNRFPPCDYFFSLATCPLYRRSGELGPGQSAIGGLAPAHAARPPQVGTSGFGAPGEPTRLPEDPNFFLDQPESICNVVSSSGQGWRQSVVSQSPLRSWSSAVIAPVRKLTGRWPDATGVQDPGNARCGSASECGAGLSDDSISVRRTRFRRYGS